MQRTLRFVPDKTSLTACDTGAGRDGGRGEAGRGRGRGRGGARGPGAGGRGGGGPGPARAGGRLTVMPMSLHAATALAGSSSVRLMMPGGEARPGELAMVGPLALTSIATLRFDTVVLGCCGISADGHVMAHDLGDAAVKQALFAAGGRRILVADAAKFGRSALAVAGQLSAFDIVVTDSSAPSEPLAELEAAGAEGPRV